MVIKRKISEEKYILAGILTLLIFGLGLTMGMVLEGYRIGYIEDVSREQELRYRSLQFQYLYLTALEEKNESCPVLSATLEKTVNDLTSSLNKFLEYEKDSKLNKDDYETAARRYLLDNLRYWLFAEKSKEICNLDIVTILYFYAEDCEICPNQGVILTYFKNIFGERLLVFPINTNLKNEPMIDILKRRYDINNYPTLIIENKKYEGKVLSKKELLKLICGSFESLQQECKGLSRLTNQ